MTATLPEPPPAGPWLPTYSAEEWLAWMRASTDDQRRALCEWGTQALFATEPVGFPDQSQPPPPRAPLTAEEHERLEAIRSRRTALPRPEWEQEVQANAVQKSTDKRKAQIAKLVAGRYVPTDADLVRMRKSLGLTQRPAARAVGVSRGFLSSLERGDRQAPVARADIWSEYRRLAKVGK